MPRVAPDKDGTLTMRLIVSELEYPALFRDLMNINSGARRRARLFGLAQMGLALEIAKATSPDIKLPLVPAEPDSDDRLTTSELEDLFGDTPTQNEEQGA